MENVKVPLSCKICGCKFWEKYYKIYASQGGQNTINISSKPVWICKACGNVFNFEQYMFDKIHTEKQDVQN